MARPDDPPPRPSRDPDPLLEAQGLGCRYRDRAEPTLAGVELALHAGEVVLLAGGSAAGKTSLLRCLNGLVPRSFRGSEASGRLRIGGRDASGWTLAQIGRHVGTLLQTPARQVVGVDVRREVAFGPENLGLPVEEIEARVREAAARVGVEALLERRTEELSGGELQKVALAGVLAMRPRVLLLDEPLAALDPESAREVASLLRELADEGRAVLVVEHRLDELAAARPDRALALERGRLASDTSWADFLAIADPRRLHLPVEAAVRWWRANDDGSPLPDAPAPVAPGRTLVDVRDARVELGGRAALDGASLAVREGEVVALLGANGAGKTTWMRAVIGLARTSGGRVELDGNDVATTPIAALARAAGLVFQDPGVMLFADSVRDELAFAPRNLGCDDAEVERRVRRALERLELDALADEAPGALSVGQKKRVALAAVHAQGVRLWLLDEPTAGLDPRGVADVLAALRSGRERETAIVFATHDLDLALTFATRVVVVDRGRVVADGPPGELLGDEALLARARLRPSGLVRANRERLRAGRPALGARELAREAAGEGP